MSNFIPQPGQGKLIKARQFNGQINQTGTSDPTITTFDDNITGIVWTRSTTGTYLGTKTGAFTSAAKVNIILGETFTSSQNINFLTDWVSTNQIRIRTYVGTTLTDAKLQNTPLQITIYP